MTLASRIATVQWGLPPARTRRVTVERGLRVPVAPGIALAADRYHPKGMESAPLVLIRCPYGRRAWGTGLAALLLAERGYQVLLQSTRGTFDSQGEFEPFAHEAADGAATVTWLREQPWFTGEFAMWGASYEAYAQWALMAGDVPELKAVVMQLGSSDLGDAFVYPNGVLALSDTLSWTRIVRNQESLADLIRSGFGSARALRRAGRRLPLSQVDRDVTGEQVDFFQNWLCHENRDDPYWATMRHRGPATSGATAHVAAHLVAGWYDIYLPNMLRDYAALRGSGHEARLVIGPWSHMNLGVNTLAFPEGLSWLDTHLSGECREPSPLPVRVFVTGAREWHDLECWPPTDTKETFWYLRPGGALMQEPPHRSGPETGPDRYRYDPSDPTPAVGGVLAFDRGAGPQDNRELEARPDVLTYTGPVLDTDLEVMGPISAQLYTRSSRSCTDFFVRLCDVHPDGRSENVCDGLARVTMPPATEDEGVRAVAVEMWPAAHRFRAGHRLRVQVSSGSHPRWARNLGDGEPIAEAHTPRVAVQEVFHDAARPSAVRLPIRQSVTGA